jgi:hypothetical protein
MSNEHTKRTERSALLDGARKSAPKTHTGTRSRRDEVLDAIAEGLLSLALSDDLLATTPIEPKTRENAC